MQLPPSVLVALVCALGCDGRSGASTSASAAPPAPTSRPSPRELGQRVVTALAAGDATPAVALLPKADIDVRIEIKQSLVETDERSAETLRSGAELAAWLGKTRPKWTCSGDGCAWPGGLKTGALERCVGDCCFSDWPGGIEKKTLYVRRVCMAAREAGEHRLSYIGFVEAK